MVVFDETLEQQLSALRSEASEHSLWSKLSTHKALCTFMESHVFAVWDFMVLLKTLQEKLTGGVAWRPVGNPKYRRLINEIVLGEETDQLDDGSVYSHMELYIAAMQEVGADTTKIKAFLDSIGPYLDDVIEKMVAVDAPQPAIRFVGQTLNTVARGDLFELVGTFAIGREGTIPAMFMNALSGVAQNDFNHSLFDEYLRRHIELDGDSHGPMGLELLAWICDDSKAFLEIAGKAIVVALCDRIKFWDDIEQLISDD